MKASISFDPDDPAEIRRAINHLQRLEITAPAAVHQPNAAGGRRPWQPPSLDDVVKALMPTKTGERLRTWAANTKRGQRLTLGEIGKMFNLSDRQVVAMLAKLSVTESHRQTDLIVRHDDTQSYAMPSAVYDVLSPVPTASKPIHQPEVAHA